MKISDKGLDLIKMAEGYHTKQRDGSCKAYRCPAGVWTCGWGCTEGVEPNTHWTEAEATEALRREMSTHEANVHKLVKVPLTQGQFDALVSICYNIGSGALGKSTLLKHLNAGDYARAASHFADFKYAKVSGDTARRYKVKDGTTVALAGLVTRRAAETQLFLEAAPNEPMPQAVAKPTAKMKIAEAVAKVGLPGGTVGGVGAVGVMQPPDLSAITAWKAATETVSGLGTWAWGNWKLTLAALATYGLLCHALPWWKDRHG